MIAWLFIGTLITFERSTRVISLFIPSALIIEAITGRESGRNICLATLVFLSPVARIAIWFISRFTVGETTTARFVSLRIALN